MRTANLVFLILFAAASCDMRPSSHLAIAQTTGLQPAGALVSPNDAPPGAAEGVAPAAQICGSSFEPASADEAAGFLRELAGTWRDELSAPVLVEGQAVVDALLIGENTVIPARLPAEGTGNGPQAFKPPEAVVIGPATTDGFRIVQLTLASESSCAVYALKLERSANGRALLVRGPLSPMGSKALPVSAFQAATRDSTRIFSDL